MSKVLRLFMIRSRKGGIPLRDGDGGVIYYRDKMVAKKARRGREVVSYGIDHKHYKQVGEVR